MASVGEIGEGLAIILEGQVEVYRYDARGERQHFYTFGPGSFLGELAQLGGRPSFGDAIAREPVKVLNFPPDRMRALLIGEAELGERLMRALILRRAQMVQDGIGGPVIVGPRGKRGRAAPRTFSSAQRYTAHDARSRNRPRGQSPD